jgi:hypothetical protein
LLRKMWPIQLACFLFIVRTIFLPSLPLCNTSSFFTWSLQLISIQSKFPCYISASAWSKLLATLFCHLH